MQSVDRTLQVLQSDLCEVLLTDIQIQDRVRQLGQQISTDYQDSEPYLVVILNGAFLFVADLVRYIDLPVELGFMAVSSYGDSTRSTGTVRIVKDLQKDILGREVLIVEDIVDTGLTLTYLRGMLSGRQPRTLRTVSLLSKPACRQVQVPIEYCGFEIPDKFVVGYGLDFMQRYRNLPCIGVMDPTKAAAQENHT
ncbi:MAG: hypoxanthine phosphoribosyltransferase [Candidatus Riflebacteria bacterium]|nr:hypoxanthine phosphoribosyltransferase [Candidatus Riflebacteria bacterium]